MSKKKVVIFSTLAVFMALSLAICAVFINKDVPKSLVSANVDNEVVSLSTFDDNTVDLDLSPNLEIALQGDQSINIDNINDKVLVSDSDGNAVNVEIVEVDDKYLVKAPKGGYIAGRAYSIVLSAGIVFADQDKKNNSKWDFIIKKGKKQEVTFQDNVVVLAENTFNKESEEVIQSDADYDANTIIILPNGKKFEAYKVTASNPNGKSYNLSVVQPTNQEVYKNIDISGKFSVTDGELVFNEELLLEQLKNCQLAVNFKQFLPKISIPKAKLDKEKGLVYLDILFQFSNIIPKIQSSFSVLVSNVIEIDPFVNYTSVPFSFNLGADMKIHTETSFSVSAGACYHEQEDMEMLIEELSRLTKHSLSEQFYRVFSWCLPIGDTGLFISYDMDLVVKVKLSGTLSATTVTDSVYKLGVYYIDGDLKNISENKSREFELDRVEMFGHMEVKLGLLNTLSISFMQFAKVGLGLEAGLYTDLYGAIQFNIETPAESQGGYYMDTGVYVDVCVKAGVEILSFKKSKTFNIFGKKFSLFELGNRTLACDYADKPENGSLDNIELTSKETVIPNMYVRQYDLVTRGFNYVEVGYQKSNFTDNSEYIDVVDGVIVISDDAPEAFEAKVFVEYKTEDGVKHTISIVKDRETPYIVNDALQEFDKANPTDLVFEIDLIEQTLNGIEAYGIDEDDYTYENGVLTVKSDYILKQENGIFEINFKTTKGDIPVWIDIEGRVGLCTVGEGTKTNPYLIYTVDQFDELRDTTAKYDSTSYFKLADDIDFRNTAFKPISVFNANLDGDGYRIYNLLVTQTVNEKHAGLIGVNYGYIVNLDIDATIRINSQAAICAGALVGFNNGIIKNVKTFGSVNASYTTKLLNKTYFNVGGIAGYNEGTIDTVNAQNKVYVNSQSHNIFTKVWAGGITGYDRGTITNAVASINNVTGESKWCNREYLKEIANRD